MRTCGCQTRFRANELPSHVGSPGSRPPNGNSSAEWITVLAVVSLVATACKASPPDSKRAVEVTARGTADPQPKDTPAGHVRIESLAAGPLAIADMNGDRHLDLVVAGHGRPLQVLFGDGDRGLGTPQPLGGGPLDHPAELAVVDHNLDGHLDLFVALHESNSIHIFHGDGTGRLVEPTGSPLAVPADPHLHSLSVGDITGDGRVDLLTDSWANDAVHVHVGRADDGFAVSTTELSVSSQPRNNVRLADLNRDGKLDIACPATREAGVTLLLGNGDGTFSAAPDSPLAAAPNPFFVAFPDFDGDGAREILVAHRASSWADNRYDALTLLRADATGRFRRVPSFTPQVGKSPSVIAVCDLDDDDTDDAVVANAADKTLTFLFGSKQGDVRSRTSQQLGGHPVALACGDLDGDNRDEVLSSTEKPDGVEVLTAPLPR